MEGIVAITRPDNACDYHRIINPLKYLGVDTNKPSPINQDTKILTYSRVSRVPFERIVEWKKQFGFKLVVDIDDYWDLNINHVLYRAWIKQGTAADMIRNMELADAVTVTTSILADKVLPHNKNVYIIPNALPFDRDSFTAEKKESDKVRFIYTGSITHAGDVRVIKNALARVSNEVDAEFILAGFSADNELTLNEWRKIEHSFNNNGRLKGYSRRFGLPLAHYMQHYENSDVVLVPLEGNHFTQYKSNLKVLEAGCKYSMALTSNVLPYFNEIDSEFVAYAKNSGDWYKAIRDYAQNPWMVKQWGDALGKHVRKHYDLIKVNELRTELYNNLINN